ncbi:hypothetical protein R1sor_026282 [Riccia sorocarpa]|uniref:Fe2OG dioxygenase domain-containing protein n=1 Tax=Riccia sorocarpa TaxID=122646 RepID=A0ABD3GD07_9MARC
MSWAGKKLLSGAKRAAEKELQETFSSIKKKQHHFSWPCPVCHRSFASYLLDDHINHCRRPSNSLNSLSPTSRTDVPALPITQPPGEPVSVDIYSILQPAVDVSPSETRNVDAQKRTELKPSANSVDLQYEFDRSSGSSFGPIQPNSYVRFDSFEDDVNCSQMEVKLKVDSVSGSGITSKSSVDETKALDFSSVKEEIIVDGSQEQNSSKIKLECEVLLDTRSIQVKEERMEEQGSAEVSKEGSGRGERPPPGFKLYERQKQSQAKLSMFFKNVLSADVERKSSVTVLQAGMVLFKNWLSLDTQQRLVHESQNVAHLFNRPITSGGGKYHIYSMCWGPKWNPKTHRYAGVGAAQPLPDWMFDFAQELCCEAQKHSCVHPPDLNFTPDVALANFYPVKAEELGVIGIGGHQDLDDSCKMPVVSVSVGDSMTFFYRRLPPLSRRKSMILVSFDEKAAKSCEDGDASHNREQQLILRSGDVLVFGGESRLIYHGTRHVQAGTRPPGLHMVPGRLNFTFRQTDASITAQLSHSSS